ncbi:arsenate reductase ArsC [Massilia terrae]|uniref:Arsenate reductase ArsC n=1 Tax=Massilia terrae TaxID=1811224 RepID=A0ABT2D020_9BURK|nr:arsenate reductase ArsC [Massilia terrae]MCS0659562.1 arsenate reductase ArsC [Massilia terrae]
MTDKTYNVLFLCTGNSARSVMAEALATTLSHGRFRGFSAGSKPAGKVNPFAIEKTDAIGYPSANLRSKSWDEFALPGASRMDFIITVCDNAAGEACPVWPGHPATAHWGFEDPAAVAGSDAQKRAAFEQVFQQIQARMRMFVDLPLESMDDAAARAAVRRIGETAV